DFQGVSNVARASYNFGASTQSGWAYSNTTYNGIPGTVTGIQKHSSGVLPQDTSGNYLYVPGDPNYGHDNIRLNVQFNSSAGPVRFTPADPIPSPFYYDGINNTAIPVNGAGTFTSAPPWIFWANGNTGGALG